METSSKNVFTEGLSTPLAIPPLEASSGLVTPTFLNSKSLGVQTPEINTQNSDLSGIFGGVDLKGLGTIASLVGGFMAHNDDKKYKKELLKREDARIARDRKRQDKFEDGMRDAYK